MYSLTWSRIEVRWFQSQARGGVASNLENLCCWCLTAVSLGSLLVRSKESVRRGMKEVDDKVEA